MPSGLQQMAAHALLSYSWENMQKGKRSMENQFRTLLQNDKVTVGTRLWSTEPYVTELAGITGQFDYVGFAAEYSAFGQKDLENLARAAELHGMGSMIKVDLQNRGYVAQKAVASGFQAVLFSDHRTAEEVRESIRLIKPMTRGVDGLYGSPTRRFIRMDLRATQEQHIQRLQDVVLCFMIEKPEAMDELEAICQLPGVDMVQFGPSDYSLSMGWNRGECGEKLKEIEKQMIETALKYNVRPRCEINSAEEAKWYMDLGVRDLSIGDEVRILENYWTKEGQKLRSML